MTIWVAVAIETVLYEIIADAPDNASTAEVEKLLQQAHFLGTSRRANSSTIVMTTGKMSEPPRIPPQPMPPED